MMAHREEKKKWWQFGLHDLFYLMVTVAIAAAYVRARNLSGFEVVFYTFMVQTAFSLLRGCIAFFYFSMEKYRTIDDR